jgi:NADH:ubiquinone oxidoreductase subunit 5 (subunit L)/multisubunit Na+/H+ antiporter MnhA subunit
MPVTYATFLLGSLSLAGVFPLAGFWSKDEILGTVWHDDKVLFWVAMAVVFLTAFYSFRAVFLTFHGEYKGGEPPEHGAHAEHHGPPHESPAVMALPLLILAVPAALAGLANLPFDGWDRLGLLLEGALPHEAGEALHRGEFSYPIAIGSSALALSGIALAWAIYEAKIISAASLQRAFGPVHTLVSRKYYVDELYEGIVVKRGLYDIATAVGQWFDTNVVDGAVNGVGAVSRRTSDTLRWVQSGSVQAYGSVGFAGVIFAVILTLVLVER